MLDIQNISKTFEKGTVNEHVAINNLSLKLEDGGICYSSWFKRCRKKVLCLIGSNEGNGS